MKVSQLMSTRPHAQEARERFKMIGESHFVRCVVFLQCSEMKVTVFRSSNLSSDIHKYNHSSSYHAVPADRKKQDAGILTGNSKRVFSDNVTCFGTNKRCSNRSHLQECFIKALRFLLAWLLLSLYGKSRVFVLEGDIPNYPDCPGRNNSHFALENEDWNMSLVFSVWDPPWFFLFYGHGVETSNLRGVSAQKLCLLTGTSWNWHICSLHAWK